MSACVAAGFLLREVGGITVDLQGHVAGGVANGRVWVSGGILLQPQDFIVCFVGELGLCCTEHPQRWCAWEW